MIGKPTMKDIEKLRLGLKMMRANPDSFPHRVLNPITGEVIDVLDGETDTLLDEIETLIKMEN